MAEKKKATAEEIEDQIDALPVYEVEDTGASEFRNALEANRNNVVPGGRYVVGNTVQNANGDIIGKVKRVKPQDMTLFAEGLGKGDASTGLEGGTPSEETPSTQSEATP